MMIWAQLKLLAATTSALLAPLRYCGAGSRFPGAWHKLCLKSGAQPCREQVPIAALCQIFAWRGAPFSKGAILNKYSLLGHSNLRLLLLSWLDLCEALCLFQDWFALVAFLNGASGVWRSLTELCRCFIGLLVMCCSVS